MEAITISAEIKGKERFQPIVQGLLAKNNENLRVASLTLINAIVIHSDDLEYRLHLRNEVMRAGLYDVLEVVFNTINVVPFLGLRHSALTVAYIAGSGERRRRRSSITNQRFL